MDFSPDRMPFVILRNSLFLLKCLRAVSNCDSNRVSHFNGRPKQKPKWDTNKITIFQGEKNIMTLYDMWRFLSLPDTFDTFGFGLLCVYLDKTLRANLKSQFARCPNVTMLSLLCQLKWVVQCLLKGQIVLTRKRRTYKTCLRCCFMGGT